MSTDSKNLPLQGQQFKSPALDWRAGFGHFPWTAGISVLVTVACIAGTVAVAISSHGDQTVSWKYQPAVWLAAISSVANFCLAAAFTQVASIAWWRGALHGTTLKSLHLIWTFGKGDFRSTTSLARDTFKIAMVASIVTAAIIVNNPLLQRVTHVRDGFEATNVNMRLDMLAAPFEVPFGLIDQGAPAKILLYTNFIAAVQRWYGNMPIATPREPSYYCNGTCSGVISSPGIDVSCTSTSKQLDLISIENDGALLFSINFTQLQTAIDTPLLGMTVLYSSEVNDLCVATIVTQQCNISTAMVERPIRIENQTLSFNRDQSTKLVTPFPSLYDGSNQEQGEATGPLSMLHWLGQYYFLSSYTLDQKLGRNRPASVAHGTVGAGEQYLVTNMTTACSYIWRRPTTDILLAMDEVLFRMAHNPGISSDVWPMATQTFSAHQLTPTLVFRSDYRYLWAAVALMAAALSALCLGLWGWWELGRSVSLSPIETAKAFGAPLLRDATNGVHVTQLVDELGHVRVQYAGVAGGEYIDPVRESLTREITHEDTVRKPSKDGVLTYQAEVTPG